MTRFPRHRAALLDADARLGMRAASVDVERVVLAPPRVERYVPFIQVPAPDGWSTAGAEALDVVFAIDDSGSMYGPWGDQHGVRRAVALGIVDLMRRGGGGRVGVVHWGSDAPRELVLPLTSVSRRRTIRDGLEIPPSLIDNNLVAALARSGEVLRDRQPEGVPLVIVITDGIEEVGARVRTQLAKLPHGSVHVLLVDYSNNSVGYEPAWRDLPLGSFTRLDLDIERMTWQAAEVVVAAVGLSMPARSKLGPRASRFPRR